MNWQLKSRFCAPSNMFHLQNYRTDFDYIWYLGVCTNSYGTKLILFYIAEA
jgi:hypothetical protein